MLAGYRYGHKWVCDGTEGRHFAVIVMQSGYEGFVLLVRDWFTVDSLFASYPEAPRFPQSITFIVDIEISTVLLP